MRRRHLLGGALALPVAGVGASFGLSAEPDSSTPFDGLTVRRIARTLAQAPYKARDDKLPPELDGLTYDQYRAIRFDPTQSLWRGEQLPFEVQFFHRGFMFKDWIDVSEVRDGRAYPVRYRQEMFNFGPNQPPRNPEPGFAGFRIHAPINRPDYYDEVAVFLGASYFRAVGRDQGYGLSARGLSIKTGSGEGEEFPVFRSFWLERPQPGVNAIVVSALLDSPSAAGAFRFTIRPGETTIFDVELNLYPRVEITEPGLATMTSMFDFDSTNRGIIDDWRPAVHDSDGLMALTGRGETVWRPLKNPATLQVSSFVDAGPRGFGLMQRTTGLSDFQDLEAHYERRPSLWIEPIGDWGRGAVQLIEIPTKSEVNDNIVAFWRPRAPLPAHGELSFTYRMNWGRASAVPTDLALFTASRIGAGRDPASRLFVLDVAGPRLKALPAETLPRVLATSDKGRIQNVNVQPLSKPGSWRVSFELLPGDAKSVELRAQLLDGDTALSETWLYRWTS